MSVTVLDSDAYAALVRRMKTAEAERAELLAALEAVRDCPGMMPTSSASEGGALKYARAVHVADQVRKAIANARGGA